MNIFTAALAALCLIQFLMVLVWLAAYRLAKTSIVDIFWSLLVLAAAIFYFLFLNGHYPAACFYLSLVFFWALRLSLYIYFRGRGQGEDARYQVLRAGWGAEEKKKMFIFFMQQGLAAWIFSLPFLILFASPRHVFGVWQNIGILIWLMAFNGESIADAQLLTFKRNPESRGKVCRVGLWKFSRHPNYFFEWLNWVAYAWMALPHSFGWLALICPVLMYYFLNKVSGVPLAEKQAAKSRSAEYLEYQRITPAFFPWPPKRSELLK